MKTEALVEKIRDILWPPNDPTVSWDPATIERIAALLIDNDYGPKIPEKTSPIGHLTITDAEYRELCRDYGGICAACFELVYGGTEPDAEGYECEACGEPSVMGAENALVSGLLEIKE